jgi:hypothetical protein
LVAVAAIDIDVGDAHAASFTRAGTGVPLPRARALTGIYLTRNVIGRRTRARGVDVLTGRLRRLGRTGRATVGSTAVPLRRLIRLRRVIRWRGVVGWRRAIGWRRRAILCFRPRHPGGRSQNPHSRDCDESTFHRLPPLNKRDGWRRWRERRWASGLITPRGRTPVLIFAWGPTSGRAGARRASDEQLQTSLAINNEE